MKSILRLKAILANRERITQIAIDYDEKRTKALETGQPTELRPRIKLETEIGSFVFDFGDGICANALEYADGRVIEDILSSWPHCSKALSLRTNTEYPNTVFPVGGSDEYVNGNARLWINPKRWDLVQYCLAELEKLA